MLELDFAARLHKLCGIGSIRCLFASIKQRKHTTRGAYAVWICVMTLVTSLNGFVYWFA